VLSLQHGEDESQCGKVSCAKTVWDGVCRCAPRSATHPDSTAKILVGDASPARSIFQLGDTGSFDIEHDSHVRSAGNGGHLCCGALESAGSICPESRTQDYRPRRMDFTARSRGAVSWPPSSPQCCACRVSGVACCERSRMFHPPLNIGGAHSAAHDVTSTRRHRVSLRMKETERRVQRGCRFCSGIHCRVAQSFRIDR